MTKDTHTPGPWTAYAGCIYAGESDKPTHIARTVKADSASGTSVGNRERRWRNARLIAAAPELLAALQTLVNVCQGVSFGPNTPDPDCWANAKAALDKATGGAA